MCRVQDREERLAGLFVVVGSTIVFAPKAPFPEAFLLRTDPDAGGPGG